MIHRIPSRITYCLIIVVLAGCDGPAPPPDAVALLEMEATLRLAWVMLYAAVQLTVAFGTKLVFAAPQLKGAVLKRVSVTVN